MPVPDQPANPRWREPARAGAAAVEVDANEDRVLLDGVGVRVEPGRVEREDGVLLSRLPGLEARGLEEAEDDLLDGDEAEDGDA